MKILILSHNPISTKYGIGKTLASLFSTFQKGELCQLYVCGGLPDADVCNSYYQLSDRAVLRGVITRKVRGAEVCVKENRQKEEGLKKKRKRSKQPYATELLRDAVWKLSPWYEKGLQAWLAKESPTCIFVAVGSGKFLYKLALKISKSLNIPIVAYVCDDFYGMKAPKGLIGKLWKSKLEKISTQLFTKARLIVSISVEISDFYKKEFQTQAVTIMTGTNYTIENRYVNKAAVKKIRYFGKLSLNRYRSLVDLCEAVDRINEEYNTEGCVEIYCGNITDEEKKALLRCKAVSLNGYITGENFADKLFSSDALIHVEAFDEISVDRVRRSVSTKIADSLACGIPLIGYGPSSISSIKHLKRNNCGLVASTKEELKSKLEQFFFDSEYRLNISKSDVETASVYHDSKKNSDFLYKTLENILNG